MRETQEGAGHDEAGPSEGLRRRHPCGGVTVVADRSASRGALPVRDARGWAPRYAARSRAGETWV